MSANGLSLCLERYIMEETLMQCFCYFQRSPNRYNPYFYHQGAYHAAYNQQGGDRGFAQAMPRGYPADYSTQVNSHFIFFYFTVFMMRPLPPPPPPSYYSLATALLPCLTSWLWLCTVPPHLLCLSFFLVGKHDGLWDGVWTGSSSPRAVQ